MTGHVKRMDGNRIRPIKGWFSQVVEGFKNGKSWQETEKERLWEETRDWRLFIH
jgi:hypothetical protein